MTTFTDTPSSAALATKPRVRVAAFGDGYEQRVADGINNAPRSWSLGFTRPTTEADAILAFFEARNGAEAFDWTPPYGAAGKFVAREWSVQLIGPVAKSISATFEEVFGA
jgi:phage-related protein